MGGGGGVARVPRDASVCRVAELVTSCLAAWFAPPRSTTHTGSLGAKTCLAGTRQPVACAHWVRLARACIAGKGHQLLHVATHLGIEGNEAANAEATEAAKPPPQVHMEPRGRGGLTYQGELCEYPHKPGTRVRVPSHPPGYSPRAVQARQKKGSPLGFVVCVALLRAPTMHTAHWESDRGHRHTVFCALAL